MAQESNFYRLYKLTNEDRIRSFKSSLLAVIIIACFALGSLFTLGLFKTFSWGIFSGGAICWILGFAFLIIFSLISSWKDFSLWSIVFSISGFLPLFLSHQVSKPIIIEVIVLYAIFLFARLRLRGEYNALVRLNWWRITYRGMFFLTTALVLIVVTLAFFQGGGTGFQKPGAKIWNYLASSTTKILPPGIALPSSSGTVDDILKVYLQKQSSRLGLEGEIGSAAAKPLLQGMKDNLSQMLNQPVKGNETIPVLISNWFKSQWPTFSPTLKISIGFLVFSLVLSILALVNFIFSFLLVIGSGLLLQLLISLKYVQIGHKEIDKEVLEL